MAKKRHTAEQIISKLREAGVLLAKGTKMPLFCWKLGIAEPRRRPSAKLNHGRGADSLIDSRQRTR